MLNPECSELSDFFKFALHEWGEPFFEIDADTKNGIEHFYFKGSRSGNELRLNSSTGKYEKVKIPLKIQEEQSLD